MTNMSIQELIEALSKHNSPKSKLYVRVHNNRAHFHVLYGEEDDGIYAQQRYSLPLTPFTKVEYDED